MDNGARTLLLVWVFQEKRVAGGGLSFWMVARPVKFYSVCGHAAHISRFFNSSAGFLSILKVTWMIERDVSMAEKTAIASDGLYDIWLVELRDVDYTELFAAR